MFVILSVPVPVCGENLVFRGSLALAETKQPRTLLVLEPV